MTQNIIQKMLWLWRITDEPLLYNFFCSWIYINIIFNYDDFSMKTKEELRAYRRAHYLKNPEHWRAYGRNYYYKHKQERKEYCLKNKEKMREYDRQYSLKNKERKRAYRLKNREKFRQWQREYYQKNKQAIKIRRYYRDELRVGAEAIIDGGTASKAVTMLLPNL